MENGPFEDVSPIKMVVFHCYVRLPEGSDMGMSSASPGINGDLSDESWTQGSRMRTSWRPGWAVDFFPIKREALLGGPYVVGNEGMESYMSMMGMKLPSFPAKGQPAYFILKFKTDMFFQFPRGLCLYKKWF